MKYVQILFAILSIVVGVGGGGGEILAEEHSSTTKVPVPNNEVLLPDLNFKEDTSRNNTEDNRKTIGLLDYQTTIEATEILPTTEGAALDVSVTLADLIFDGLNSGPDENAEGFLENGERKACDNFYQYVCGNWSEFSQTSQSLNLRLVDSLQKEEFAVWIKTNSTVKEELHFLKNLRTYYTSCMTVQQSFDQLEYLKWLEVYGNLNTEDSANNNRNHWLHILATLHKYGLNNVILQEEIMQHPIKPKRTIIVLKKPSVFDVANVSGSIGDIPVSNYTKFENKLIKLATDYEDSEGFQLLSLQQLRDKHLTWLATYLAQQTLSSHMEILLQDLPYMRAVERFLQRYDAQFVGYYIQLKFLNYISSPDQNPVYQDDCATSTRLYFPLAIEWLFTQQHPSALETSSTVREMFENLKETFEKRLWYNYHDFPLHVVEHYFVEKLKALQVQVLEVSSSTLEDYYGGLTLNSTDYYGNHLKMLRLQYNASHAFLFRNFSDEAFEFYEYPRHTNSLGPYLLQHHKRLVVPLTFLQPFTTQPVSNDTLLRLYSSLGYLMAREIMNAFYSDNLKAVVTSDDSTEEDVLLFITPNYYHYKAMDQVDGNTNALHLAYAAWYGLSEEGDFSNSSKNLFFLNFAELYCGDNSPHSPDYENIVNSAISSNRNFSAAFQCSMGDHMYSNDTVFWFQSKE